MATFDPQLLICLDELLTEMLRFYSVEFVLGVIRDVELTDASTLSPVMLAKQQILLEYLKSRVEPFQQGRIGLQVQLDPSGHGHHSFKHTVVQRILKGLIKSLESKVGNVGSAGIPNILSNAFDGVRQRIRHPATCQRLFFRPLIEEYRHLGGKLTARLVEAGNFGQQIPPEEEAPKPPAIRVETEEESILRVLTADLRDPPKFEDYVEIFKLYPYAGIVVQPDGTSVLAVSYVSRRDETNRLIRYNCALIMPGKEEQIFKHIVGILPVLQRDHQYVKVLSAIPGIRVRFWTSIEGEPRDVPNSIRYAIVTEEGLEFNSSRDDRDRMYYHKYGQKEVDAAFQDLKDQMAAAYTDHDYSLISSHNPALVKEVQDRLRLNVLESKAERSLP